MCDLGSGAGFDVLLAAKSVGPLGKVIGVDMVPAMLEKARAAAKAAGLGYLVEYRLGEIEHLPLGDGSVDVVLSNCVINLSPDKKQVTCRRAKAEGLTASSLRLSPRAAARRPPRGRVPCVAGVVARSGGVSRGGGAERGARGSRDLAVRDLRGRDEVGRARTAHAAGGPRAHA